MKYFSLLILVSGIATTTQAQAKSWRVNNNPGVTADFTSWTAAVNHASVKDGDTLYMEPSATDYASNGVQLAKKLIVIGPGYYLNPADATKPGNAGLQASIYEARIPYIYFLAGASGSKFIGISLEGAYLRATTNITFERVRFIGGSLNFDQGASSDITVRKCFFDGQSVSAATGTGSNFIFENNIVTNGNFNLPGLSGSNNIVRNNTFHNMNSFTIVSTYFVNNIVDFSSQATLTNCTIKNNVFRANQTLPGTATDNLRSQVIADVLELTGSFDGKFKLKATSPAKGAGLTVGTVNAPDCGAYGATDPYVLSGIPNVPSIYSFTAPNSIPSGTATMNVTFSTRNNN